MLRLITDGKISPDEAVRAYHGVLQGKGIKAHRSLDDDLKLTDQAMSYDGSATKRSTVEVKNNPLAGDSASAIANPKSQIVTSADWPKLSDGKPEFSKMNSAQRQAYDAARLQRIFG